MAANYGCSSNAHAYGSGLSMVYPCCCSSFADSLILVTTSISTVLNANPANISGARGTLNTSLKWKTFRYLGREIS